MPKPFLLLVLDHDKQQFTVEGPMTDDTPWIDAIFEAQKAGRELNCSTPGPGESEASVINNAEKQFRFGHVPRGSIVRPKF